MQHAFGPWRWSRCAPLLVAWLAGCFVVWALVSLFFPYVGAGVAGLLLLTTVVLGVGWRKRAYPKQSNKAAESRH